MRKLISREQMPLRGASSARARRAGGFTMVEMLAVLTILAILVALAVGVGEHVMDEAKRKQTIAAQEVVMQAIQAYHDSHNDYPAEDVVGNTVGLMEALSADGDANELLKGLAVEAYVGTGGGGEDPPLVDGYGAAMRYRKTGGLGGGPVLISAGKDGDFGYGPDGNPDGGDDEPEKKLDNIRSDGK